MNGQEEDNGLTVLSKIVLGIAILLGLFVLYHALKARRIAESTSDSSDVMQAAPRALSSVPETQQSRQRDTGRTATSIPPLVINPTARAASPKETRPIVSDVPPPPLPPNRKSQQQ